MGNRRVPVLFLERTPMNLSPSEAAVLRGLAAGGTLKIHRHLDGRKICKFYPLDGPSQELPRAVVERLKTRGLIDSNKKFPAATYLLTQAGKRAAESLSGGPVYPLAAKN
ncbi:MAG: hypothetical protein D6768_16405 [Chloroflexi bacterium]|nr:MAG: hypothetical protein D6768_16405 [Chloroflexota bacterium]